MTAAEFCDWRRYYQHEPFGPDGDDARLTWLLFNLLSVLSLKPVSPADCKIPWGTPEKSEPLMISARQGLRIMAKRSKIRRRK